MLVAVVILYAVLWLPMNVFQLCFNLLCYQSTNHLSFCSQATLIQLLYITAHFLSVSNTAINPIIYGFLNNCFRVSQSVDVVGWIAVHSSSFFSAEWCSTVASSIISLSRPKSFLRPNTFYAQKSRRQRCPTSISRRKSSESQCSID